MKIGMIDTLEISFDVSFYDKVFTDFLDALDIAKGYAQQHRNENSTVKEYLVLNDTSFEVLPNGSLNHAFILHSPSFEIKFAQARSKNENFYPIIFRVKSCALWSQSPELACAEMYRILRSITGDDIEITERIKRLDLCCHTDEFSINESTLEEFQGKYRKNTIFRNSSEIETYSLGARSNSVFCRIYNKTKEVKQSNDKQWFFDIWKRNSFNIDNVWNVEFELKREFLKDAGINTIYDLFSNIIQILKVFGTIALLSGYNIKTL